MKLVPREFAQTLTTDDLFAIMANDNCLTEELRARYYRMLDIQNPPPNERISVWFDRKEVEQMIRRMKREIKKKKLV